MIKITLKSIDLIIDGGDDFNKIHLYGGTNPETDNLELDLKIAAKLNGQNFNQMLQNNLELLMQQKIPNNN